MDMLIEAASQGRLLAFVGAGISMIPPTCLPSWWDINEAVIVALTDRVAPLIGGERSVQLAATISARQHSDRFPPEYQAELLAVRLGASYFRVLQCLDSERPNAVHLRLARLAAAGHLAAIVTTNFDRALEAAFRLVGAPLRVCARAGEFDALAPELEGKSGSCVLLKLHGSADDPATLIDTLAQRKRGLPVGALSCLRTLLRSSHWLFLGWSGADLDADPGYLGLATACDSARGFTWLYRGGENPRPSVARICAAYGERAAIVHGELPRWLDRATASLLDAPPSTDVGADSGELGRQAREQVASHARGWAEQIGRTASALGLADILVAVGEPHSAIEVLRAALQALPKADREDRDGIMLTCALAGKLQGMGEDAEALTLYQGAAGLLDARGDNERAAEARGNAGLIYQARGELTAARSAFEGARRSAEASSDDAKRSVALHNVALVHGLLGEYDEGERLFREEIEILKALGDEPNQAVAYNDLGYLLAEASRFDAAVEVLTKAVRIRERLGNDRGRAMSLGNLAKVHFGRGDLEAASAIHREVIEIFRRLGDEPSRITAVGNLAVAAVRQGQPQAAIPMLRKAIIDAEAIKRTPEGVRLRMNLGEALREAGQLEAACEVLEESERIAKRLDASPARAETLLELGITRWRLDELEEAERLFREVVAIWDALKQEARVAPALTNLGLVAQQRGHLDDALDFFRRGLDINARLGKQAGVVRGKLNLGNVALQQGRLEAAIDLYTAARELADDLKLPLERFGARAAIASTLGRQGKAGAALAAFRDAEAAATLPTDKINLAVRLEGLAELYAANDHQQIASAFSTEAERLRAVGVAGA